jgi:Zn-dependent protease
MFLQKLFTDPLVFLWWLLIAVFSVCVHELFHALAAYWQGDTTARDRGYFTLNPLVHMGAPSILILLLTGMCWGSCPVNPSRFRHHYSDALVSFAGPFANLLLMALTAFLAALLFVIPPSWLLSPSLAENLGSFLNMASLMNGTLFLLNMIPIPPLDGFGVLAYFVPGTRRAFASVEAYMFPILFFLLMLGLGQFLWSGGSILSHSVFYLSFVAFRLFV